MIVGDLCKNSLCFKINACVSKSWVFNDICHLIMQEVKQIHPTCKEVSIGINFFSNSILILANDIDVLSKSLFFFIGNEVFRRSFYRKFQLIESCLRYDVLFLRMLGY